MKKYFAMFLAAVMLFALAACTTTAPTTTAVPETTKAEETTAAPEETTAAAEDKGADYDACLAAIGYTGEGTETLTIAISPDFAPMEFVDLERTGEDQFVGFDFLLSKYIGKKLGMKIEFKPMSFDAVLAAVKTGTVDLGISGFSWTPVRAENYLISEWYESGDNEVEQVVITLAEKAGTLSKPEDFAGLKVGAQGGSLQQQLVNEQLVPAGAEIQLYENLNDAVTGLLTGKIDVLAVAKGNGDAFISANEGKIGFGGLEFEIDEKYKNNVILLNQNSTELLEKVNKVLTDLKTNGDSADWYEACKKLANITTVDEAGYDDEGNKIEG